MNSVVTLMYIPEVAHGVYAQAVDFDIGAEFHTCSRCETIVA
jgi:hypothetical protein